jgi:hypothetical protein
MLETRRKTIPHPKSWNPPEKRLMQWRVKDVRRAVTLPKGHGERQTKRENPARLSLFSMRK